METEELDTGLSEGTARQLWPPHPDPDIAASSQRNGHKGIATPVERVSHLEWIRQGHSPAT